MHLARIGKFVFIAFTTFTMLSTPLHAFAQQPEPRPAIIADAAPGLTPNTIYQGTWEGHNEAGETLKPLPGRFTIKEIQSDRVVWRYEYMPIGTTEWKISAENATARIMDDGTYVIGRRADEGDYEFLVFTTMDGKFVGDREVRSKGVMYFSHIEATIPVIG